MANELSKSQPQRIPLAKIHDLPGVFISKQPDKTYGGLVTSIQANGVKEAVILRLREDGEYQLVAGYRRRRASELAKLTEIPAYVYEMTLQEATAYYRQARSNADTPIPGKLVELKPPAKAPDAPVTGEKPKEGEKLATPTPGKEEKGPTTDPKPAEQPTKPTAPAPGEKPKEGKPTEPGKDKGGEKPETGKPTEAGKEERGLAAGAKPAEQPPKPATPAAGEKPKEDKPNETNKDRGGEKSATDAAPGKGEKGYDADPKPTAQPPKALTPTTGEKPKEGKPAEADKGKEAKAPVTGPAAKGPAGTAITQIFEPRLAPPDEKALRDLPVPKDGESLFITLHPAYLKKSKFNTFSVDTNSENFKELLKSVELVGIKDPVLTRIDPEGGLEILSGQRRHLAAGALNYPVPAIIQKIDDADAKIIVADGNLHRDKISTYDLSRALRMKMEGMKQKAGRKKKGFTAEELDSDEKLAKEMGMSVSKLNRILRLSEASKDVCDRVDDGHLTISTAASLSFLPPKKQDMLIYLMDMGYKAPTERIEYLKKVEKAGKLDEMTMRKVLDGQNVLDPPKVVPPAPAPTTAPGQPSSMENRTVIPPSPDVKPIQSASDQPPVTGTSPTPATSTPPEQKPEGDVHSFKGEQERPEHTKVILTGDRLRKYFPDVNLTPREIEESVYEALEERRQRQLKQQNPLKRPGLTR